MLRYPGGKLRLMAKIDDLIRYNYLQAGMSDWVVAEPFTGGGGSLINMAEDFPLWKFRLNDLNKEVASLWRFFKTAKEADFNELYGKILRQKATIKTYKEIFESSPTTYIDKAFRVIFLNKTSFNGYVTEARPIGGWKQESKWGVDVYWKPPTMVSKIERARKALEGRILSVSSEDFETFLNKFPADFTYSDPPYISYGKEWYNCSFGIEDLTRLRKLLLKRERWCVSIDRHPETEALFADCCIRGLDIKYSSKSRHVKTIEKNVLPADAEMVIFPEDTTVPGRALT